MVFLFLYISQEIIVVHVWHALQYTCVPHIAKQQREVPWFEAWTIMAANKSKFFICYLHFKSVRINPVKGKFAHIVQNEPVEIFSRFCCLVCFFIELPNVRSLTLFIDWVFATVCLLIELRISRHIFSQSEWKPKRTSFPALTAGFIDFLCFLIGSMGLLWLANANAMVSVLAAQQIHQRILPRGTFQKCFCKCNPLSVWSKQPRGNCLTF